MRFASLGSGSKGNATVVRTDETCIVIDCGFSLKETERRLQRLQLQGHDIDAILLTHEHGDHARGIGPLARKYDIPVWTTRGTIEKAGLGKLSAYNFIDVHESFSIGQLDVQPYPVPHDAREPCQFVFRHKGKRFGMLTDAGMGTQHIESQLTGCDALLLECNHDPEMLADGPYPPSLKQRVASSQGHLSNVQAAELLSKLDCSHLKYLVAAHLSEQNNDPILARQALAEVLDCDDEWIIVADQDDGLDWCEI
ncbi:MAG: MBL fold metallo-hydrolase [Gammaproteobacteria bacterium]|nr:MBL fold metallo-hydrolase [Gammaproteobacteria bacterium]